MSSTFFDVKNIPTNGKPEKIFWVLKEISILKAKGE